MNSLSQLSQPLLSTELQQCSIDPSLLDNDPTLLNLLSRIHVGSQTLKLGTECRVTALVLFHRYYQQFINLLVHHVDPHRLKTKLDIQLCIFTDSAHRRHLGTVAAACIFLACKTENQPRRIRDVVNLSHMLDFTGSHWNNDNPTSSIKGTAVHIVEAEAPPALDEHYWEAKQQLVSTELALLRFISYHVQVTHPHRILVVALNQWIRPLDNCSQSKDRFSTLLYKSWRILNDTLFSPACLRLPVLNLVCASIQLAINEYTVETGAQTKCFEDIILSNQILLACPTAELQTALQVVQQAISSL